MGWTEERVSILRDLWGNGKSASQIAEILGGFSRNAVIGKAHRLGLSVSKAPKPKAVVEPVVKAEPKPKPRIEQPRAAPLVEGGATILNLTERMCRWPIGDPRDPGFRFCGSLALPGLPYCSDHAAVAYQQPKPRREEGQATA